MKKGWSIVAIIVIATALSVLNAVFAEGRGAMLRATIKVATSPGLRTAGTPHLTEADIARLKHNLGLDRAEREQMMFLEREIALIVLAGVAAFVVVRGTKTPKDKRDAQTFPRLNR
ncbi:MAG TPA: hypothetical protein VK216_02095 [Magnetospirillaceae bacterium]|nr:hypothetical protein [Magnetospirillaceae bacterium]